MIGGPFFYPMQRFSICSFMRGRQSFIDSRFKSAVGAFVFADAADD